jgi:peptide/nickel transport system substrate-binding protein
MRRTASRSIAAVSALIALAAVVHAARRPTYGGELRVSMRAAIANLDPSVPPDEPTALAAYRQWSPFVFETLVRLDDRGRPRPWLATSWRHDAARRAWIFSTRANVKLHDGSLWSPAGQISFPDNRTIEQILLELSRSAIVIKGADGVLLGTGPFRIAAWEAGKSATFAAHDQYWGGRPYLDSISLQMGRSFADQSSDFQVGRADVIEIPARDAARQRGAFSTQPVEAVALQFDPVRVPVAVRQSVAASIDRTAIHNVLLQKQGEISNALLPRWLTGYSFLFRTGAGPQPLSARTLSFSYDRQDPVIRPIAERIAVNASAVGITLRQAAGRAEVQLLRLPITSQDPILALQDLALLVKTPLSGSNAYESEKGLIDGAGLAPLFHLPHAWALGARVKNWPRLEEVWLDAGAAP